jgi:dipeptidyl aminopeptidase/acylaminoacyl peptidase
MRRIFLLLMLIAPLLSVSRGSYAAAITRGNLIFDNVTEMPPEKADRLDAYLSAREASSLGWSPKDQLLISTRFGDVDQLHQVDRPGGALRQLTFLHEPITQAAFSPDPNRGAYLFLKDAGGNENTQLYYQRTGEPTARLLSDGKSRNGAAVWSNSGRQIAFFSSGRDGVSNDIDIVEPESGALPRLVMSGDSAAWYPLDWSPDDSKLLILKQVSTAEGYLYVLDLNTGQRREVDPASDKVAISAAKFSRDGQGVYLISDHDSEFERLCYINLFTAQRTDISGHIPWDIEQLSLSRDGHYLAYVSNEGGFSKLNAMDLRTHQDLVPPKLPGAGVIDSLSFDAESKRLAFGFAAAYQPRDAYVLDMASNHLEAWTQSEPGAVNLAKFTIPRLQYFPTFDRSDGQPRQIPVYVYEPARLGPHPVLIMLHGGPQSQFRPSFDPWIQYAVNELGFAVVAPNVRGSSGYGKSYLSLDNGTLREDAVKDVGALIVWLGLHGSFDAKRVVVSGVAYGGYLTLAALINYGDRLRGGVDLAGVTDFVSFLSGTAPDRQTQRRAEFGDERDPDMRAYLRRISPLTNADRITRPLLLVHGRNDPRVPITETEQLLYRVRSRGGVVWYLQATDEGQGFRKKANRDAYYRAFAQFLKTCVE